MKFLKRLLSKRNNGGFTLIEVVISVGLLGVLLVAMTIFVTPILQASNETQTDIRAGILAESLEAYIDRSVKVSKYVTVFSGVSAANLPTIYGDVALDRFDATKVDPDYEVRCIGINWETDVQTNEQKYMLKIWKVKEGVGTNHVRLDTSNKVFEDCFYDGLFPEISVEQLKLYEEDGVTVKQTAPALWLEVNVYNNAAMSNMAMAGDGYVQFLNIDTSTMGTNLKFVDKSGSAGGAEHLDTYIFYIARKSF